MSGKLTANILAAGIDRIRMDDTGYYALLEFPTDDGGVKIVALPSEALSSLAALALSMAPRPADDAGSMPAHRVNSTRALVSRDGTRVVLRVSFAQDAEIRFEMLLQEARELGLALQGLGREPPGHGES